MKGIREIKGRIKSVKNTAQITKAMQLVAASKMKRAQDSALAGRPYAILLAQILFSIREHVEKIDHPLFTERPVKHRGLLVVSTDKGLCGALNHNLFRMLGEVDRDTTRHICIGRKATQYVSRTGRNLLADFSVSDKVNFSEVRVVVEYMIKQYLEGEIDTIEVLYPMFVNSLTQEPRLIKLAPLGANAAEALAELQKRLKLDVGDHPVDQRDMIFEPSAAAILEELPPLFIKQEIYQVILDAKASEHSARMVAMKSATDNAKSLVEDLSLEYNKARQAAITQEILEIAAATANN
jgi:F-type H+-transporting ATPase subunit gamma